MDYSYPIKIGAIYASNSGDRPRKLKIKPEQIALIGQVFSTLRSSGLNGSEQLSHKVN
ncbi:hypothetical protein METHB2_1050004 [Candidatus Methylobacter favarea]|uniref:Uncharacterized protein n=1 Tax=Candidatus Methylobacter favarea TaxID=2707345 RepID=A0A8S0Y5P2_9GAMM|nr:hypothetical protein METHB2_1050004 [Candidatus Methylobacter favarea]